MLLTGEKWVGGETGGSVGGNFGVAPYLILYLCIFYLVELG